MDVHEILQVTHPGHMFAFYQMGGGKRQLLAELDRRLPTGWNTYFEPFVGGGALLVHLRTKPDQLCRHCGYQPGTDHLYHIVKQHPCRLLAAVLNDEFRNDADSFNRWKRELTR